MTCVHFGWSNFNTPAQVFHRLAIQRKSAQVDRAVVICKGVFTSYRGDFQIGASSFRFPLVALLPTQNAFLFLP